MMSDDEFNKLLDDFTKSAIASAEFKIDNTIDNKNFLIEELLPLLGISKEELQLKDETWIKSKIRKLKLKIINN